MPTRERRLRELALQLAGTAGADEVSEATTDAMVDLLDEVRTPGPLGEAFQALGAALRAQPRLYQDLVLKARHLQRTERGALTDFLAALRADD